MEPDGFGAAMARHRFGPVSADVPVIGQGTWYMDEAHRPAAVATLRRGLDLGMTHIDTAEMYGNEDAVGEALANAGVPRGDVHVTTKVWFDHLDADAMQRAIEGSLRKLRTDYVDLYLIHWPAPDMDLPGALHNLMRVQEQGKARAIGVSNFPVALLRRAVEEVRAPIACNQIEYHVLLDQDRVAATVLARVPEGWVEAGLTQGCLDLPELGVSLPLASICRGLGFDPA